MFDLVIRFVLEITDLVALAWIGWLKGRGVYSYLMAVGIPLYAAALWGIFAVPDDPGRSGRAPVAVPGTVRLLLEIAFFFAATWALVIVGVTTIAWIYGITVLVHYVSTYDRVLWLVQQ